MFFTSTLNKITEKKPNEAYCQPENLWIDGKSIRELRKINSVHKNDIGSWLPKQTLWEVHLIPPSEINRLHYNLTKPNVQRQFDLLYVRNNVFEGNT